MILMYALKTPLSAQCAGVLSTEHSVQSNPSALSALSTEMHHQNKTLSTKCCHSHGHSVLSTSTVCAPGVGAMNCTAVAKQCNKQCDKIVADVERIDYETNTTIKVKLRHPDKV